MLDQTQKQELQRDGFVHLKGAVAPELVNHALQTLNARLGEGVPKDELATWNSQSFFPELGNAPVITDLYNASSVGETVASLLGGHGRESGRGQLALRFPRPVGTQPRVPGPHIDGVHSPNNGVPKGTLGSFTALIGVFLTPVRQQFAGNFAVWPGSHLKMQDYFRKNGIDELLNEGRTPQLDYGEGLQLQVEPGDAVIAHYQLLHGVTMNIAPMPRFAVFFRVIHPHHKENRLECLTNLWLEWPGIR
ncbi:hypothetical protein IAD21_00085 [Abditibacteriota bacterium]|nr:hypothetical protein IAD21_00085 [Abditibacteriota bacterium]